MTENEINELRGCPCLTQLQKQADAHEGQEVELQLGSYFKDDPDATEYEPYSDLLPLRYKFKKDKRMRTGHFSFLFCPFCGKKKP